MRPHLDRSCGRSSVSPAAWGADLIVVSDATVDPDRLRGLQETYGDLAAQLVALFEGTAADTLAELRDAVAAGDGEATRGLAHRLKGGARNVGATGLAELTFAIERGAVAPAPGVGRLAAALDPTVAALRAAIA